MAAPISSPTPIGQRLIGIGSPPAHLLIAQAVAADGTLTLNNGVARSKWSLQCIIGGTGSPVVLVDLYLSINGTDWWKVGSWSTAGGQVSGDIVSFVDKLACAAYCKLTTLSGGTTPSVDAWVAAQ